MELELGLAPPTNTGRPLGGGKRGFGDAFGEDEEQRRTSTTTLPLFDDGSSSSSCDSGSGGGVGGMNKKALVGWPPVSSARSRACGRHVKVWKEGAAIGRKVYLPFHGSYADLLATLARMFPDPAGDRAAGCPHAKSGEMVVTYEDADGDWMLVGDVPWEDFARSVKRLKILL
ncbi:hypothetical protein CFC21_094412 [Triticum aestivum]|uniref:Auxin-responsive protein n=2 Tax=Triticum aestivum TaxID=4565 RepID=A0A3B6QNH5_WHEAT|nr:auxin-responsive protein IAA9-like [Triticum aestivum]KAF7091867.1 hypothetical protein CFC21_094412 [Triticum aestivum]